MKRKKETILEVKFPNNNFRETTKKIVERKLSKNIIQKIREISKN